MNFCVQNLDDKKHLVHGFCIGLFTSTTGTKWQKVVPLGVVTTKFMEELFQLRLPVIYKPLFIASILCYVEVTHAENASFKIEFGKVRYKNTSYPP